MFKFRNHNEIDKKLSRYISGNGYRHGIIIQQQPYPGQQQIQPYQPQQLQLQQKPYYTNSKTQPPSANERALSRTRYENEDQDENEDKPRNDSSNMYSKDNSPRARYPTTTYETRRSAFLIATENSAKATMQMQSKSNNMLGRVDWAQKYLTSNSQY